MTQHQPTLLDDVDIDALERDPYPFYTNLRREAPVAYSPQLGAWLVSRWADCEHIGKSATLADGRSAGTEQFFGPNILNATGDVHRWLRGGVDPPLRPRAVQGYIEERARPVAAEYVARLRDRGRADATQDILELISVRVIADVLGLADQADEKLQLWFQTINSGLNDFDRDPAVREASARSIAEIDAYMRESIARRTDTPDESAISHMIHSGLDDGPPRTYDDLIGTIRVVVVGGFQEPGHGAAASLLGLLRNPEQLRATIAAPEKLIPDAVHEGLRWISPFGLAQRCAVEDIEVGGVTIPKDAEIQLMLGSANRDEARYDDPAAFDVHRPRQAHAAFGYGAHFCSGHFISRQLERIALDELLKQLPGLRLDPDTVPTVHGFGVRGVKRLPIVWDA